MDRWIFSYIKNIDHVDSILIRNVLRFSDAVAMGLGDFVLSSAVQSYANQIAEGEIL
jgi:hypothetical protein